MAITAKMRALQWAREQVTSRINLPKHEFRRQLCTRAELHDASSLYTPSAYYAFRNHVYLSDGAAAEEALVRNEHRVTGERVLYGLRWQDSAELLRAMKRWSSPGNIAVLQQVMAVDMQCTGSPEILRSLLCMIHDERMTQNQQKSFQRLLAETPYALTVQDRDATHSNEARGRPYEKCVPVAVQKGPEWRSIYDLSGVLSSVFLLVDLATWDWKSQLRGVLDASPKRFEVAYFRNGGRVVGRDEKPEFVVTIGYVHKDPIAQAYRWTENTLGIKYSTDRTRLHFALGQLTVGYADGSNDVGHYVPPGTRGSRPR